MTAKIHRRFLLALAALAVSLAAVAPAARADFAIQPSAFAKAHAPLTQPMPPICEQFQCIFFGGLGEQDSDWVQSIKDAPELTQAGAHPDFSVHFRFEDVGVPGQGQGALGNGDGRVLSVLTDAPAGAVGNPLAVPRCEQSQFHLTIYGACPPESQVGLAVSVACCLGGEFKTLTPVSSLVPAPGQPGLLGFKSFIFTAVLTPEVRSDGDYGLRVTADPIPNPLETILGNTVTLWGVPHDPVHDPQRVNDVGGVNGHLSGTPVPFLSAPTNCSSGPLDFTIKARSWENPDIWTETTSTAPQPTGCDQIDFNPTLSAQPTTNRADQPSGLEVDVHTPQNNQCVDTNPGLGVNWDCGFATSHLRDTKVTLPAGLTLNPSGANGLEGCSTAQIGLTTPLGVSPQQFSKDEPSCPDASRIAGVEVDTPLLDAPMPGSVYLAKPFDNPFKSLLAIYIVADDHAHGIIVKLAGKVEADPVTGQLSTTVTDAPQLPFEHFFLHFKQGPHATLRTPACGDYSTTGELTPYSAPDSPVAVSDNLSITQGPGGSCDQPNAPSFDAGTVSPLSDNYSPMVIDLRRADGSQQFKTLTLTPPPGLLGKLAGIPACSEAGIDQAKSRTASGDGALEQSAPSCPVDSQVGTVGVAAGAGPSPYNAKGKVYMAGPYQGAPLSFAIVTPAVAGPFDLGVVVVRTALHIDPVTAQITAVSDPIPDHLTVDGDGFPLDVTQAKVKIDRDQFIRTGTNCDEYAFSGSLLSTIDQSAPLSSRYQLGECSSLGFKPHIGISLKGGTKRNGHPAATITVTPRSGDANLRSVQVTMPKQLQLDQSHIQAPCTRPQFAAGQCPAAAVIGTATATSPLVDYTLSGPVYLRTGDNPLPDVVLDLHGPASQPITIDVVNKIDTVNARLRATSQNVPDAPVTQAVIHLLGGGKGLLVNNTDICAQKDIAGVSLEGQNGLASDSNQKVAVAGCRKKGHKHHKRHHRRAHRRAVR